MGATQALCYLWLTQLRSRLMQVLRNCYKPVYLLGIGVFVALALMMTKVRSAPVRPLREGALEFFELMIGGIVTMFVYVAWVSPQKNSVGLVFSEAEAGFFFPAPIPRRLLLHFKMLDAMAKAVLMTLPAVLFLTLPNRNADFAFAVRVFLVVWSVNLLFMFQGMAAGLLEQRARDRGWGVYYRSAVITVGVAVLLVGVLMLYLGKLSALLGILPGRLLIHSGFVYGIEYLLSQYAVFAVLGLHYWWILQMQTPFEEQALALAARRAALVNNKTATLRPPEARPQPFTLTAAAPFELILLWKGLLTLPAYFNRRVLLGVTLFTVALLQLLPTLGGDKGEAIANALGQAALASLVALVAFAPSLSGVGIGVELTRADLVKSWPVRGWRVMLGSALMPLLVITALGWWFMLGAVLSPRMEAALLGLPQPLSVKLVVAAGVALSFPLLQGLQLVLGFVPPIFFTALVRPGGVGRGAMDMLGIGLLMTAGASLLLGIALMPVTLVVAAVLYLGQWFALKALVYAAAFLLGLAVLVIETLFVVHQLGERFERMDIATELRM